MPACRVGGSLPRSWVNTSKLVAGRDAGAPRGSLPRGRARVRRRPRSAGAQAAAPPLPHAPGSRVTGQCRRPARAELACDQTAPPNSRVTGQRRRHRARRVRRARAPGQRRAAWRRRSRRRPSLCTSSAASSAAPAIAAGAGARAPGRRRAAQRSRRRSSCQLRRSRAHPLHQLTEARRLRPRATKGRAGAAQPR